MESTNLSNEFEPVRCFPDGHLPRCEGPDEVLSVRVCRCFLSICQARAARNFIQLHNQILSPVLG